MRLQYANGYELYTADDLDEMPTQCQGQADDLKLETPEGYRYWLCRCGVADGVPCNNLVTIEACIDGRWQSVFWYDGDTLEILDLKGTGY